MPGSILGTEVRRVEDLELLLGQGTFVDNRRVEGLTHAVFVRSPMAHARITAIDTSASRVYGARTNVFFHAPAAPSSLDAALDRTPSGTVPPWLSRTAVAARCKLTARRL